METILRSCNRCHEEKPASPEFFGVSRTMPLGLQYTCRPCEAERQRAYSLAHPERRRAAYKKHVAKRLAEAPEQFKAEVAARMAKHRQEQPEKAQATRKRFLQRHPEKNQEWVNRYRARKLAATVEAVDYAAVAERDRNVCHICGLDVDLTVGTYDPMARTFDHVIPLSRGGEHSFDNVKVAHRLCNVRKNNRFIEAVS